MIFIITSVMISRELHGTPAAIMFFNHSMR
jgi:hypothetical protein